MPGRMPMERGRQERTPVVWMFIHGLIASAIGIAVGLAIEWFPPQGSTQAKQVDTVWDVIIVSSVPIFVAVMIIVLFSVVNFRMRPGEENLDGPPIHGNTKLEVYWTAGPAIILVALCSYSYVELRAIEKPQPNEMHVMVTGQQFAWTFAYPQAGGKPIKTTRLVLPIHKPVKFIVRSPDVLHDFWVPAFRMKIDAVPGIDTSYRITPARLGTYPVVCAELCGLGHSTMRNSATVVSAADFATWLTKQKAPAATTAGGKVDAKKLFTDGNGTATACGSCHTLADAGTTAQTGPDLGKVLKGMSAVEIKESIVSPSAKLAPGFQDGIMPKDYGDTLSPEELDALVKYLGTVAAK
jgi:cytochrome c oxidase subunit II